MTRQISTGSSDKRVGLHRHLYVQVLVAIVCGGLLGYFFPRLGADMKPLGDAFVRLVKMVIAPVIFLTISTGVGGLREGGKVARITFKALAYFIAVSTFALVIGLVVANVFQPGAGMNIDPATLQAASVSQYAAKAHAQTPAGFLVNIIPETVGGAFTGGDILQVLFFSVMFGLALGMSGERGQPVREFLDSASSVVFRLVAILMRTAPIGAFGAFAFTIGKYGVGTIAHLAGLVGAFYLTAIVFVAVVLGAIGWLNGFSIFRLVAYLKDELLLVLGTSSSEAALPNLMEKLEAAGCEKTIVGLVVPTGYSFNLDGTNIYMTLAALFIAQATGVHLSLPDQLLLLAVAILSSKGAAGVTGAGFITLAATLSVVPSVPVAGMALILGVDRFMSECRALTNLIGNAVATIVVARWEGGLDKGRLDRALKSRPAAEAPDRRPTEVPQPSLEPTP
ncbi:MAG: dicarboxylate/amino acid:cation symporter [Alphaproteobacteria bacterium]|nr:dicarboxylate/amino acid:cation symporter [Alphaproteobacteria bacterium]